MQRKPLFKGLLNIKGLCPFITGSLKFGRKDMVLKKCPLMTECSLSGESLEDRFHCTVKPVFKGHSNERTPSDHCLVQFTLQCMLIILNTMCKVEDHENHVGWIYFHNCSQHGGKSQLCDNKIFSHARRLD